MLRVMYLSLMTSLFMSCAHQARSPSAMNSWEERGLEIHQMEWLRDY